MMRASLIALALAGGVAACGPLVQIGGGGEPPPVVFTLRSSAPPATQAAPLGAMIVIAMPTVPGSIQTLRVPVITRDTEIAYLQQAAWIEPPARLFQRLLGDVIGSQGRLTVVDPRGPDVAARRLTGQLLEFGLDMRGSPQVRVRYDAALLDASGRLAATRRFERVLPAPSQLPSAVAAALNDAANAVAADVATWVGTTPSS